MSSEQVMVINDQWGVIIDEKGNSLQGVTLDKYHIRTTLDPLHLALIQRLISVSQALQHTAGE